MAQEMARFIGAKNRDQGATLEEQILTACGYYKALGLAAIDKTPEPMRILRRMEKEQFVACFSKKAQPDFQGTLSSGRAVMFEAKTTRTGKIEQSAVTAEQAEYLDNHAAMNALCFVVVSFIDTYATVPWSDWKRMKELFGHKHMTKVESAAYRVGYGKGGVLDFMNAIKRR